MERDMWAAAVSETEVEIASEPYGSLEYAQAVLFFTAVRGAWAESRQDIADCLGVHADDLSRWGRSAIAARHLRDGPEPVRVRVPAKGLPTKAPGLCVTNPAPVVRLGRPPDGKARPPVGKRKANYDPNFWFRQVMARQAA